MIEVSIIELIKQLIMVALICGSATAMRQGLLAAQTARYSEASYRLAWAILFVVIAASIGASP